MFLTFMFYQYTYNSYSCL